MPGHLNNEFEVRNLNFLTLQQTGNLLFVPSYSDLNTVYKKIEEAKTPDQKTQMLEEMGEYCTQVLLDLKEKEEARRDRELKRHLDMEEAFNKEHQFTEWVHVGKPPNTLVTIEDIDKWYGEDTRKETKKLFAIRHLNSQKERFVELVKDAIDAGALEVYERHDDFLRCRFRRHEIFHWLGNARIVDELKREHIIIIPIVDEMIELHKTSESQSEPAPKTNEEQKQTTPSSQPEKEAGYSFKWNGAAWDTTFRGKSLKSTKDTDGMSYIAILLCCAIAERDDKFKHDDKIDSVKLYGLCKAYGGGVTPRMEENFLDEEGQLSGAAQSHPQQEIITSKIIKETENEIQVLKEKLEELKLGSDTLQNTKKIEDHEHEIHNREHYLKKTTRPDPKNSGKRIPKNFTGPSRGASGKIHHALKKAYQNIEKSSPGLAAHLKESIKSENNKFEYWPPDSIIPDWSITLK